MKTDGLEKIAIDASLNPRARIRLSHSAMPSMELKLGLKIRQFLPVYRRLEGS